MCGPHAAVQRHAAHERAAMAYGKRGDMLVHEDEPYNAEPPPEALAGQPLTALDAFYSRNHGVIPNLDPLTWRLRVDGLVGHRLEVNLEQLRGDFEQHSLVATLQCAGNRRKGLLAFGDIPGQAAWGSTAIATAEWTGVRLRDVLAEAGLHTDGKHIEFSAPDDALDASPLQKYGSSIPVSKANSDEVLLAWAMNGEPLPAVHGAPVRVVVPGYIGARSVKWLQRIRVLAEPSLNYFQAVAYRLPSAGGDLDQADADAGTDHTFALGAVPLTSDILFPVDGDVLPAGTTTVRGYTFTGQGRRISRVEVSVDLGQSWLQARVDDQLGPWAWQLWQATVSLPPGPGEILARAWDGSATQPESARSLWNPKGYLNNSSPRVQVSVRPGSS